MYRYFLNSFINLYNLLETAKMFYSVYTVSFLQELHNSDLSIVILNPLKANPEKWSNTLKQIVSNLPTICLSVFDHFMNLALKGLMTLKCF